MRPSPLHPSCRKALRRKRGQTLVEYGLIATMISVLAIAVLTALGTRVKGTYSTINSQLATANSGGGSSGSGSTGTPGPPSGHGN